MRAVVVPPPVIRSWISSALHQQEHAAEDQHQVADGGCHARDREQRRSIRARWASVTSEPMRVMQATAMPMRRASGRRASGRRPTAIEMKTRLSMPSTISSAESVTRVSQASGERKLGGPCGRSVQQARHEDQPPTPATRSSCSRTPRPSPCPLAVPRVRGVPRQGARSPLPPPSSAVPAPAPPAGSCPAAGRVLDPGPAQPQRQRRGHD